MYQVETCFSLETFPERGVLGSNGAGGTIFFEIARPGRAAFSLRPFG
jgi:hypothetical protein